MRYSLQTAKRTLALLAAVALTSGCGWQMSRQPRYRSYAPRASQPQLTSSRRPPAGTVEFHHKEVRPRVTEELLNRGEERYNIYCAVCHGKTGAADGVVVQHGFPKPPSFLTAKLRKADDRHFWSAITNGAGRMYPYANRVSSRDRWAITAWIRVLQKADELKKGEAKDV